MKNINFKPSVLFAIIVFFMFSCEKEQDLSRPINNERFKAPSVNDAKFHFEKNNKAPVFSDINHNVELRTDEVEMTIKWDESSTKKYKEETQALSQQVDILYTPIKINTGGNAKMFLASIEDNGTLDSKYLFLVYTAPENPKLFSGYVFIYDLDGNLEDLSKYEEGNKVAIASNSSMEQRDDGNEGGGFTMGELLDFIGGDWFGLDGFIENDLVNVYWPEFSEVDDIAGGDVDNDSSWYNPSIHIPIVGNNGGGNSGSGNSNNDNNTDDIVWWQPITIFAHGISISNVLEVDLGSIEGDWLMNTATQEQLDAIANYINNLEQTESDGYNQGDIDYIMESLYYMMLNSSFYDIIQVLSEFDMECQGDIIRDFTLMDSDSPINNFVQNVFFNNDDFNLQYEDVNLSSPKKSQTLYPNGLIFNSNNFASIQFDNDFLANATDLAIVMTTAHEFIHLFLGYLYSQGQLTLVYPEYGDLEDALDIFKNNPTVLTGQSLSDEMHSIYDDHLDWITEAVFAYATANNIAGATESYCRTFVIGAHPQTNAYQNLNSTEKLEHDNVALNEIESLENSKGSNCND